MASSSSKDPPVSSTVTLVDEAVDQSTPLGEPVPPPVVTQPADDIITFLFNDATGCDYDIDIKKEHLLIKNKKHIHFVSIEYLKKRISDAIFAKNEAKIETAKENAINDGSEPTPYPRFRVKIPWQLIHILWQSLRANKDGGNSPASDDSSESNEDEENSPADDAALLDALTIDNESNPHENEEIDESRLFAVRRDGSEAERLLFVIKRDEKLANSTDKDLFMKFLEVVGNGRMMRTHTEEKLIRILHHVSSTKEFFIHSPPPPPTSSSDIMPTSYEYYASYEYSFRNTHDVNEVIANCIYNVSIEQPSITVLRAFLQCEEVIPALHINRIFQYDDVYYNNRVIGRETTVLHQASLRAFSANDLAIVKALIDFKADVNLKCKFIADTEILQDYSIGRPSEDIFEFIEYDDDLLKEVSQARICRDLVLADCDPSTGKPLKLDEIHSISRPNRVRPFDRKLVEQLRKLRGRVNRTVAALHAFAAGDGVLEVQKNMLELFTGSGANINEKSEGGNGKTPLHIAAATHRCAHKYRWTAHHAMLSLINARADVFGKDEIGCTPLHVMMQQGFPADSFDILRPLEFYLKPALETHGFEKTRALLTACNHDGHNFLNVYHRRWEFHSNFYEISSDCQCFSILGYVSVNRIATRGEILRLLKKWLAEARKDQLACDDETANAGARADVRGLLCQLTNGECEAIANDLRLAWSSIRPEDVCSKILDKL